MLRRHFKTAFHKAQQSRACHSKYQQLLFNLYRTVSTFQYFLLNYSYYLFNTLTNTLLGSNEWQAIQYMLYTKCINTTTRVTEDYTQPASQNTPSGN